MKRILLILLAALMMISLVACGEKKDDSSKTASSEVTDAKDADESENEDASKDEKDTKDSDGAKDAKDSKDSDASSKKYPTLKKYLEDPANIKGIDAVKESSSGTMDIDVKADGNTMVYDYTYRTKIEDSDLPGVKQTIDSSLDSTESTFVGLADTLQNQIEEDIKVKIVYRNADGEVITERTFEPSK